MNPQQNTLEKERHEYRVPTGAVLALADPPEAGWLLEKPVAQEVGRPLVLPERDRRPACDRVPIERGARR